MLDYSQLNQAFLPSWRTLYDTNKGLPENLLSILKKTVFLPHDFYDIIATYYLIPSALARVVPYLFFYGVSGSGKSTLAKIASKLHGVQIHSSADSFAAIRNDLQQRKWNQDGIELNTCMVWDDIDPNVFSLRPDIYRMFKFGYDRSSDTISISSDKTGQNLRFNVFCPKIFSSVAPLHLDSDYPEFRRRLLVIKTKKIEDFTELEKDAAGILEGMWQQQLVDPNLIDWDGFNQQYIELWGDLEVARYYLEVRKLLADMSMPGMNSHQRVISFDLLATGIVTGIWSSEIDAVTRLSRYWRWFSLEMENSQEVLYQLLEEVIKKEEENAKRGNVAPEIPAREIKLKIDFWYAQGILTEVPNTKQVAKTMYQLGYRQRLRNWVKD